MTTEEMLTALNAKVLDMEKELMNLKGRDHSATEKKLEALKDRVDAILAARLDHRPDPAGAADAAGEEKDELAVLLGD